MGKKHASRKRSHPPQNGASSRAAAGIKDTEIKLARYSIIAPLLISVIICFIEIYALIKNANDPIDMKAILIVVNGYLACSLISSACFILLQQFFLFIPAGVNPDRGIFLFASFFVYTLIYVAYLASDKEDYPPVALIIADIAFFIVLLVSLKTSPAQLDVQNFSGNQQM